VCVCVCVCVGGGGGCAALLKNAVSILVAYVYEIHSLGCSPDWVKLRVNIEWIRVNKF
jgi:hypothetical protein